MQNTVPRTEKIVQIYSFGLVSAIQKPPFSVSPQISVKAVLRIVRKGKLYIYPQLGVIASLRIPPRRNCSTPFFSSWYVENNSRTEDNTKPFVSVKAYKRTARKGVGLLHQFAITDSPLQVSKLIKELPWTQGVYELFCEADHFTPPICRTTAVQFR